MGYLGPVHLAWAHLRHKGIGLLGPLLLLVLCHLLLFVQVGVALMPQPSPVAVPPGGEPLQDRSPSTADGPGEAGNPVSRGIGVGVVCLGVLLLFRHVLATEMAGHSRELALLYTLGYSPAYLHSVALAKMLLLVSLAFIPALVLLPGVDVFVRAWIGWCLAINLGRVGVALFLALLLGLLAAALLARKARHVEPASLLR